MYTVAVTSMSLSCHLEYPKIHLHQWDLNDVIHILWHNKQMLLLLLTFTKKFQLLRIFFPCISVYIWRYQPPFVKRIEYQSISIIKNYAFIYFLVTQIYSDESSVMIYSIYSHFPFSFHFEFSELIIQVLFGM